MTKNEILKFFADEMSTILCPLTPAMLESRKIGQPDDFARPLLISLVEELEDRTNKRILAEDTQPMKYLGPNVTIGDLADYFSAGSRKIQAIRTRIFSPENIILEKKRRSRKEKSDLISRYSEYTGVPLDENILNVKIMECYLKDLEKSKDWVTPLTWIEDDANTEAIKDGKYFTKWVNKSTTLGEFLDVLCS